MKKFMLIALVIFLTACQHSDTTKKSKPKENHKTEHQKAEKKEKKQVVCAKPEFEIKNMAYNPTVKKEKNAGDIFQLEYTIEYITKNDCPFEGKEYILEVKFPKTLAKEYGFTTVHLSLDQSKKNEKTNHITVSIAKQITKGQKYPNQESIFGTYEVFIKEEKTNLIKDAVKIDIQQ